MSISAMVALVILSEAFMHYFPWRLVLRGRELPRLVAYVLGVLGLMVPFTIWLIELGEWDIIQALWLVLVSGGSSVLILYALDHVVNLDWKAREGSEWEHVAREQTDGASE